MLSISKQTPKRVSNQKKTLRRISVNDLPNAHHTTTPRYFRKLSKKSNRNGTVPKLPKAKISISLFCVWCGPQNNAQFLNPETNTDSGARFLLLLS